MAIDKASRQEQKVTQEKLNDIRTMSSELKIAIGQIIKTSTSFNDINKASNKFEVALAQSVKTMLSATEGYHSEQKRLEALNQTIDRVTKGMDTTSREYLKSFTLLQHKQGLLDKTESLKSTMRSAVDDIRMKQGEAIYSTTGDNDFLEEVFGHRFDELIRLVQENKGSLSKDFVKAIEDSGNLTSADDIDRLITSEVESNHDLEDEIRLEREALQHNTDALKKETHTKFGKASSLFGKGMAGMKMLSGFAAVRGLIGFGKGVLEAQSHIQDFAASAGIASTRIQKDFGGSYLTSAQNYALLSALIDSGGVEMQADTFHEATRTLATFASLFNMEGSSLAQNIIDFSDGLYISNNDMTASLKSTTERLVGLGAASHIGAKAMLSMAAESSNWAKGMGNVFGAEGRKALEEQMTSARAALRGMGMSKYATDKTIGSLANAMNEALQGNFNLLSVKVGGRLANEFMDLNPFELKNHPNLIARMIQAQQSNKLNKVAAANVDNWRLSTFAKNPYLAFAVQAQDNAKTMKHFQEYIKKENKRLTGEGKVGFGNVNSFDDVMRIMKDPRFIAEAKRKESANTLKQIGMAKNLALNAIQMKALRTAHPLLSSIQTNVRAITGFVAYLAKDDKKTGYMADAGKYWPKLIEDTYSSATSNLEKNVDKITSPETWKSVFMIASAGLDGISETRQAELRRMRGGPAAPPHIHHNTFPPKPLDNLVTSDPTSERSVPFTTMEEILRDALQEHRKLNYYLRRNNPGESALGF